ncbi:MULTISPECIES: hypothetical protein [Polaromonas]|uniref:Uncharacterized protein n=1 Tax=Polaromonas aquatica TaxID=332657 RepID=A0ABW1TX34_9BURK
MGHALTSTAACNTAEAIALEKAKLGEGAKVVSLRRKAWDSFDLAYVVQGAKGELKDVVVTNAALKRRMAAATA